MSLSFSSIAFAENILGSVRDAESYEGPALQKLPFALARIQPELEMFSQNLVKLP
jgi:hypothetical protein